jgi:hypothetical protein
MSRLKATAVGTIHLVSLILWLIASGLATLGYVALELSKWLWWRLGGWNLWGGDQ